MDVSDSPESSGNAISRLMTQLRQGESSAAGQLVELLYPELRRLAAARIRTERSPHTWQPTVLVHELYLELRNVKTLRDEIKGDHELDKRAFLGLSAFLMRRLLVHHARPLAKRVERLQIDSVNEPGLAELQLREIEDALQALESIHPELRQVTEMKVFGGLTTEEIAGRWGCSVRSVERRWTFARTWLKENFVARIEQA
jgi:RNA polymerase sigma factor (TIGR02999 family)